MTQVQREKIIRMKSAGKGYQEIAAQLGLSYNTVKSFCRRANLNVQKEKPVPSEYTHCRQCGNLLIHKDKCKKKKFCSDSCRLAWWNVIRMRCRKRHSIPWSVSIAHRSSRATVTSLADIAAITAIF